MKKTMELIVWILLMLAVIWSLPAAAGEVSLQVNTHTRMNDDSFYQIGHWTELQGNYQFDNDWYVFGSYNRAQVIPLWGIGDLEMLGAGGGFKTKLTSRLSFYAQVGYYFVSHENEGLSQCPGGAACEGMGYYFNARGYDDTRHVFTGYELDYQDSIGISGGITYMYPLTRNVSVGANFGYRFMNISETMRVFFQEGATECTPENGYCWEEQVSRDGSSMYGGLVLKVAL